jgi:hypothetical protein
MVESRIRRISPALARFEEVKKTAQIGAARRISPPWYGFRADLAIAGQVGVATPLTLRVKRFSGTGGAGSAGFYDAGKVHSKAMIPVVALRDRVVGPRRRPGHATGAATVIDASADGSDLGRLLDFWLSDSGSWTSKKTK